MTKTIGKRLDAKRLKLSSRLITDTETANRVANALMIRDILYEYDIRWSRACLICKRMGDAIFINPNRVADVVDELTKMGIRDVSNRLNVQFVTDQNMYSSIYVTDNESTRWIVHKNVAKGGFGSIRKCIRNGSIRIVKLEPCDSKYMLNEIAFYETVTRLSRYDSSRFPDYHGTGTCVVENDAINRYVCLEFFPIDMAKAMKTLSIDKLKKICISVLDALRTCHDAGFSHGDIKAGNILIDDRTVPKSDGYLPRFRVALTDFGLCRRYIDEATQKHVEFVENPGKIHGTKAYMSVDAHLGVPSSRRSDIESLTWCVVEWFGGILPWTYMSSYKMTLTEKQRFYKDDIEKFCNACFGDGECPPFIKNYLTDMKTHSYADYKTMYSAQPDYDRLKRHFEKEDI